MVYYYNKVVGNEYNYMPECSRLQETPYLVRDCTTMAPKYKVFSSPHPFFLKQMVQRREQMVQRREQMVRRREQMVQRREQMVQRREQMVQRREQMVQRREQNGVEKRTNGAEKRTK